MDANNSSANGGPNSGTTSKHIINVANTKRKSQGGSSNNIESGSNTGEGALKGKKVA